MTSKSNHRVFWPVRLGPWAKSLAGSASPIFAASSPRIRADMAQIVVDVESGRIVATGCHDLFAPRCGACQNGAIFKMSIGEALHRGEALRAHRLEAAAGRQGSGQARSRAADASVCARRSSPVDEVGKSPNPAPVFQRCVVKVPD